MTNTKWGVLAGDGLGNAASAGARGYITTSAGTGNAISSSAVSTDVGNLDTYLTQVNIEGNHSAVSNGGSTATLGAGYAGTSLIINDALTNKGPVTLGAVGIDLAVVQVSNLANSLSAANQYTFANNAHFNLSNTGLLTYSTTAVAAVPEADTWAMMFMGLGLMGFIARRKQA